MDSKYDLALEAEPKPGDMKAIVQGLLLFNSLHTGGATPNYIVITVRDADKAVVGGLVGATYLGWLQVQAVWLPDELRGQGYGSALLAAAEEEAVRRGCANACLETFGFQALAFYEKRGYVVFAQLSDFPPGGAKYFLAKPLGGESRAVERSPRLG
jgi:GNAT superfamily N-acetyltransferase